MASSEWMELENLSSEIANSISRLEAAKLVGSNGLAQVIEKEIAALEERRSRLLATIASSVVGDKRDEDKIQSETEAELEVNARPQPEPEPEPGPATKPIEVPLAEAEAEPEPEEPRYRDPVEATTIVAERPREPEQHPVRAPEPQRAEPQRAEVFAPMPPPVIAAPEPSRYEEPPRRGPASWNQLTPGDVERAKRDLNQRRIETLARHAAELRALDADQEDIDALERAIEVFTRKFAVQPQPAGAEVVRLEPERGARRSVG